MVRLYLQVLLGISALLLAGCNRTVPDMAGGEYKTMTVGRTDRVLSMNYSAVINGRQSVEIRPQISGTITDICIDEGASVRKGQVLFIIDQVPYKATLKTAEANVRSAEAGVATASLTAVSKDELFKENVVSEYDRQTAHNSLLEAEAALAQAKAEETKARNDLSYTEIKSPVDGVAGMMPYRVGSLVSPSISSPLVTVSDDEEMHVYFSMTEKQILSLVRKYGSLDKSLENMPDVELLLCDGELYTHKGRIDAVSGTVDTETGAVRIRATFPNPERMLRNGGTGTVVFPYVKENVIVVPQEATFEIQDKVYVYTVDSEGKAVSSLISVFPVNDGKEYIVEEGLEEGEVIVAEGAGLIRENTLVVPVVPNIEKVEKQ